jgi:hypothetical protein
VVAWAAAVMAAGGFVTKMIRTETRVAQGQDLAFLVRFNSSFLFY